MAVGHLGREAVLVLPAIAHVVVIAVAGERGARNNESGDDNEQTDEALDCCVHAPVTPDSADPHDRLRLPKRHAAGGAARGAVGPDTVHLEGQVGALPA
jgi:hypothetical protein